ncbi:MAG: hypothetical protein K9J76_03775 [Polaromonas sp.]|nr:hypothetical protein [Polaromonas sp.]
MAIGWLSVLKMVPWGDVIENAPKVANGAKKLWQNVGKKPSVAPPVNPLADAMGSEPPSVAALQAQVAGLQVAVADLHQQMLASSELIQSLADQNAQLVKRVEVNRVRLLWLGVWLLVVTGLLITRAVL